MKTPNVPKTFKRPRLYFCDLTYGYGPRMRIIYPNGTAEWTTLFNFDCAHFDADDTAYYYKQWQKPCWNHAGQTAESALAFMNEYDRLNGIVAQFVGEI